MPALSVITPIYNGASFVSRCYNNLLDQTFKNWEWIIVDDGSTDGTVNEVKKITDPRVRLVSYPTNMGRGFARSRALAECQGDWMVVWDVDDLNFPERLEQIDAARIQGYDFFCSYTVVCTNQLDIKGVRGFFLSSHGLPNTFVYATMACRLDIAKKIGYDATVRTGEDAEIVWVLPANYSGMWCKNALYVYQEDREVNLQKSIDSNMGHLRLLRKLFRNKSLRLTTSEYVYLCCKYSIKLALLHLLKLKPELYLKSVASRSYGEVDPLYSLSGEQIAYIQSIKNSFCNSLIH
jgi:glycosyltransferase involved in cell wall biosynthesis